MVLWRDQNFRSQIVALIVDKYGVYIAHKFLFMVGIANSVKAPFVQLTSYEQYRSSS
jgi:hypothetical protein